MQGRLDNLRIKVLIIAYYLLLVLQLNTIQSFCNSKGKVVSIIIEKVLCVLKLPMRLLSPKQLCQQYRGSMSFTTDAHSASSRLNDYLMKIPYNHSSNLPILCTESNVQNYLKAYSVTKIRDSELDNLSCQQRQLLTWYCILGYMGFTKCRLQHEIDYFLKKQ